jgi:hypothetical protein
VHAAANHRVDAEAKVAHFQHGVLHVCELASLAEVGDGE